MPDVAKTAYDMISGMKPELRPGVFLFVTTDDMTLAAALTPGAIAIFKEDEGLSMIVPVALAEKAGLATNAPMRWITLNVYSSLEAVGLTAAVSNALADQAIPCNMVAAFHHDHVFVPADLCGRAMEVLTALQEKTAKDG